MVHNLTTSKGWTKTRNRFGCSLVGAYTYQRSLFLGWRQTILEYYFFLSLPVVQVCANQQMWVSKHAFKQQFDMLTTTDIAKQLKTIAATKVKVNIKMSTLKPLLCGWLFEAWQHVNKVEMIRIGWSQCGLEKVFDHSLQVDVISLNSFAHKQRFSRSTVAKNPLHVPQQSFCTTPKRGRPPTSAKVNTTTINNAPMQNKRSKLTIVLTKVHTHQKTYFVFYTHEMSL